MGIEPISVVDIANYAYPKQLLSLFYTIGYLSKTDSFSENKANGDS